MADWRSVEHRIEQARTHRKRPREADRLGEFLPQLFKREVRRPFEQLGAIGEVWAAIAPPEMIERTSLRSFRRGVLTIGVDSTSTAYELNRRLAGGLERQLRQAFRRGTLRRVKVVIEEGRAKATDRP